jgi:NADPH:quinone reductase-like Zn-dependent oxidoreductase
VSRPLSGRRAWHGEPQAAVDRGVLQTGLAERDLEEALSTVRAFLGLGLRRPRRAAVLGSDVAGVVEGVGEGVSRFRPGDEVYATVGLGGFGEVVAVREDVLALKPAGATFEEAAAVPMAAITALQGLRDVGSLQPGQRVLINGASGGVGSFAVQLARTLGAAVVTGVCSTGNLELVRSIGADHVIDYTTQDLTRSTERYDLVVDTVGNRSLRALCRVATREGTVLIVGGGGGRAIGPVAQLVTAKLQSPFGSQRVVSMLARRNPADLAVIAGMIEEGKVRPVTDRTYPLVEAADALRYLETRHARGKVVVTH